MVLIHACGFIIYTMTANNEPTYLLIRSAKGKMWGYPKGKQDPDELDVETARREVKEETGITVKRLDGFKKDIHYLSRKDKPKRLTLFLGKAKHTNVVLKADEVDSYDWLTYEQALDRLSFRDLMQPLTLAHRLVRQQEGDFT
ncbi:MAG: bis(5'-nucleosyl)-tetraphosphatase [Nanoarchaeota archaeon]